MYRVAAFALLVGLGLFSMARPAEAQDGCQTVTRSCSQMFQGCAKTCEAANNQSRCLGSVCEPKLGECKATGVWKSGNTAAACWRTNNRT